MADQNILRAGWRRSLDWLAHPATVGRFASPFGKRTDPVSAPDKLPRLSSWQRIGIVRYDGLGDLVNLTGFLRELRRNLPAAELTLVCRPEHLPLLEGCPYLNRTLGIPLPAYRRFAQLRWLMKHRRWCERHLIPLRWDAVLLPQTHFSFYEARYFGVFSQAPLRIGWADLSLPASSHELAARRLLTHLAPQPEARHEAEKTFSFLEQLGGTVSSRALELWTTPAERAEVSERWHFGRPGDAPVVALGIGASKAEKIWPAERFSKIALHLHRTRGWRSLLVGGQDCRTAGQIIQSRAPDCVLNVAGDWSLRQTMAALTHCRMFVGNDSGPLHLAAASGIPVVALSSAPANLPPEHPMSPLRIGPFCSQREIVQPPARGDFVCGVEAIEVSTVQAAIEHLLARVTA